MDHLYSYEHETNGGSPQTCGRKSAGASSKNTTGQNMDKRQIHTHGKARIEHLDQEAASSSLSQGPGSDLIYVGVWKSNPRTHGK